MKKLRIVTLMVISFIVSTGFAQQLQKQEKKNKIFEKKLSFLKENLMLNKDESKDFENLYLDYHNEKQKLKKQLKEEVFGKIKKVNVNDLSEKEQVLIIEQKLQIDKKRFELNNNFTKNLLQILAPVKVIRYYQLERQFNKRLLKRMREKHNKKISKHKRLNK
jgi:hypothetical protein